MTDKITREEAKEVIQRIRNCVGEFKPTSFIHFPVYRNTIPALDMAIKSLDQDRPIGHWIDYSDEGYVECPYCEHATNWDDNTDELHYCFWCGARMVEPQESEE